jgi:hypothetical protein
MSCLKSLFVLFVSSMTITAVSAQNTTTRIPSVAVGAASCTQFKTVAGSVIPDCITEVITMPVTLISIVQPTTASSISSVNDNTSSILSTTSIIKDSIIISQVSVISTSAAVPQTLTPTAVVASMTNLYSAPTINSIASPAAVSTSTKCVACEAMTSVMAASSAVPDEEEPDMVSDSVGSYSSIEAFSTSTNIPTLTTTLTSVVYDDTATTSDTLEDETWTDDYEDETWTESLPTTVESAASADVPVSSKTLASALPSTGSTTASSYTGATETLAPPTSTVTMLQRSSSAPGPISTVTMTLLSTIYVTAPAAPQTQLPAIYSGVVSHPSVAPVPSSLAGVITQISDGKLLTSQLISPPLY